MSDAIVSDSEKAVLTRQFMNSDFWLHVLKPAIDERLVYAQYASINAPDPNGSFGWCKYQSGLLCIENELLPMLLKADLPKIGQPNYTTPQQEQ